MSTASVIQAPANPALVSQVTHAESTTTALDPSSAHNYLVVTKEGRRVDLLEKYFVCPICMFLIKLTNREKHPSLCTPKEEQVNPSVTRASSARPPTLLNHFNPFPPRLQAEGDALHAYAINRIARERGLSGEEHMTFVNQHKGRSHMAQFVRLPDHLSDHSRADFFECQFASSAQFRTNYLVHHLNARFLESDPFLNLLRPLHTPQPQRPHQPRSLRRLFAACFSASE